MRTTGLVLAVALGLLSGVVAHAATVHSVTTGTLKVHPGDPDGLGLDGQTFTVTTDLDSATLPNPFVTNSTSSVGTFSNVTTVSVTAGPFNVNCPTATIVLTDNVTGQDTIAISGCKALGVTLTSNITLPGGHLVTVVPAGYPSVSVTGQASLSGLGGTGSGYDLINATSVASGPAPPAITRNPTSWSPTALQGSTTTLTQNLTLSASAPVSYSVSTTGGSWLTVAPTVGNTSGGTYTGPTLVMSANPTGLAAGTYNGSVVINTGQTTYSVAVTFTITAPTPTLIVPTTPLTFNYTIGGSAPAAQPVSISGTAGISFTASGNPSWLVAAPSSGTVPSTLSISINTAGLVAGTVNGTVTVTSPGATGSPATIPVTLNVSPQPTLTVPSTPLTFNYQLGSSAPAAQPVSISGTSGISFTSSTNQTWLVAAPSSGTVPSTLNVSINTASLTAGTFNGTVTVTSPGATGSPATIPVTLNVTAPSLTATPPALSFSYQIGGSVPASQAVAVGGTSGLAFTAAVTSGNTWLSVAPTSGTVPASINASVNITGLAAGTYNGTIAVSAPGATTQNVAVTLVVTSGPTISATPSSMSFTYVLGGSAPASQPLALGGTSGLAYTLASDQAWLVVSPTSGTTPGSATVSVTPGSLTAATYTGHITVTAPGADNSPVLVPVTFTVAAPTLTVPTTPLTFDSAVGGTVPPKSVSISGSAGIAFTAASNQAWLTVTPTSGTVPRTLTIGVNTTGLALGTYTGAVTVTSPGATGSPATIPVTLNITTLITVAPTALTFTYQMGGALPASQSVAIGGASGLKFKLTADQPWVGLAPAFGDIPGSTLVTALVNSISGLAAGTYHANITVTATGASNSPVIPITLTVTQNTLTVPTAPLTFNYTLGGTAPPAQPVSITGTSGISFTASNGGTPWLSVTPTSGTVPGSISIAVSTNGLAAGTYTGNVTVSSPNAAGSPATIPVTLKVVTKPTLTATPSTLSFTYQLGGTAPPSQSIAVGGGSGLAFTAAVTSGSSWLSITPTSGTTPGSVAASVKITGLAAGTYNGNIAVTAAGASNSPLNVPVTLTVSGATTLTTTPHSFTFNYTLSGSLPPAQTLTIGSGTPMTFSVSASGGTWLSVTAAGTTTPGSATVSVNPTGLAAGTYGGVVTVTSAGASNSPLTVAVTLNINAGTTITATPATLSLSGREKGTAVTQTISVTGTGATAVTATSAGGGWLVVSPSTSTTPSTLTVTANPSALTAGTYTGAITISGTGANTVTVSVTFAVTTAGSVTGPVINGVSDGAGYKTDAFAPGSIISIFGDGMGPDPYVSFSLNGAGGLDPTLAGVSITVDGAAAIPLLSWKQQVNAIIPYSAKTSGQAEVVVTYNGSASTPFNITMAPTAFKLFAADATGKGPGAILNQDFSVNTASNPADKGSVVQLFGAGGGALLPAVVEGGVAGAALSTIVAPYSATVNGEAAKVVYAGTAPGLVFGVYQVNVELPADVATGSPVIVVKVGDSQSQPDITVFVK